MMVVMMVVVVVMVMMPVAWDHDHWSPIHMVMVVVVSLRHLHSGLCRWSRGLVVNLFQQGNGVRDRLKQVGIAAHVQDA